MMREWAIERVPGKSPARLERMKTHELVRPPLEPLDVMVNQEA